MESAIQKSLPTNGKGKSVLVAALDWGLGHATRCVPIINELQNQGAHVLLGGSGPSLVFLRSEFPELPFYELPSYRIGYPEKQCMALSILWQLPKVWSAIKQEKKLVSDIIENEKLDFILSDNRYGCFSKKVRSVFIGHQLNLQVPRPLSFLSQTINYFHLNWISNFDEVWVPDEVNGFSFSGILSNANLANIKRIGILSRFNGKSKATGEGYDWVALISGPEPQRTVFENLVRVQLLKSERQALMVKGKPGIREKDKIEHGLVTEVNHLATADLELILASAKVIVARPGYSTIMDLTTLGKQAIFIPTPGQTEQEYLGQYLMSNNLAFVQTQDEFDLVEAFKQLYNFKPLPKTKPNIGLPKMIVELMSQ